MYPSNSPIVVIVGTRPEAIKMIPVYYALKHEGLPVQLCITLQHDQLLMEILQLFHIVPDYNLHVMRLGQDLFYLTQAILQKTKELFVRIKPSLILVHGDTTSAMAAALAAFYLRIPVAHIEAGLRTETIMSPFPEEMNRRFIGLLAQYHFAPTATAVAALRAEGVARSSIFCVGNTVVDILRLVRDHNETGTFTPRNDFVTRVKACKETGIKIMLLTMHRRESFDSGITNVLKTIVTFLQDNHDVFCFYPFHPNPTVLATLQESAFSSLPNTYLCEPILYKDMVYLLQACDWVVTDSGGLQEEAVSLGKPVLVTRENTERPEGVWAGLARLVGTDTQLLINALYDVSHTMYTSDPAACSVYGDGYAAQKIARIIKAHAAEIFIDTHQNSLPPLSAAQHLKLSSTSSRTSLASEKNMKKVCVIGLGYIGLPTALVAAEHGFNVCGVDIDEQRVRDIMQGNPVIDEPDLSEKLSLALQTGTFVAQTTPSSADYYIIAVPTPILPDTTADITAVFAAADALVAVLRAGATVILESTVPVGTTEKLAAYLSAKTGLIVGKQLFVAHCPERVLPGNIVRELIDNARIIGGVDRACVDAAKQLYRIFVKGNLYLTDAPTAEMVKLVENSSRDAQLAFAHQVASMAYAADLNPYEVIELANKHPRVNILQPTCGVGGHCIAVDPWFLVHSFAKQSDFIRAARITNDAKPYEVINRIQQAVAHWHSEHTNQSSTKIPTVLLLGLTYKPDVNDIRESPALMIAQKFIAQHNVDSAKTIPLAHIVVCEPHLNTTILSKLVGDCVVSMTEGAAQADIIVYLVAHKRFAALDTSLMKGKKILDFCGILHKNRPESDQQEHLFWPASKGQAAESIYLHAAHKEAEKLS